MAGTNSATDVGRFEVRVTSDSHFSWMRTRLSLERMRMPWVRTAVALIGFGFAIVQYFNHLQDLAGTRAAYLPGTEIFGTRMQSPVIAIAVLLICIGLFAFFAALLRLV